MEPHDGVSQLLPDRVHESDVRSIRGAHTYAFTPSPGAKPTGKLAMRPMAKEARADIAAVVVINSRRTSSTQVR